jgi:hypothetical protein
LLALFTNFMLAALRKFTCMADILKNASSIVHEKFIDIIFVIIYCKSGSGYLFYDQDFVLLHLMVYIVSHHLKILNVVTTIYHVIIYAPLDF